MSEGDRVIAVTGIWRNDRFPDLVEQAKLQALSDSIDAATGFDDADHRAVEYTLAPKGMPAAALDATQREVLRHLLGTYFGRVPEAVSSMRHYDEAALDAVHFAWAGSTEPAQPSRWSPEARRLWLWV